MASRIVARCSRCDCERESAARQKRLPLKVPPSPCNGLFPVPHALAGIEIVSNPVETWKAEKHGLDIWPDIERYAAAGTPMKQVDAADLERMKWYGYFYRKRDGEGRYMCRVRLPASQLTAPQAREIAFIAYELGHGIVDLTTRANIQVQGLEITHLPEASRRLDRVGLTSKQTGHDNVRNVFGHPFSGLLPDELIDTTELCHAITALFVDSREYADLPRKMNICLNGSLSHSAHFWTQDLSFLAVRDSAGDVRFQVLIGGTQGQNPHLAWHLPVLVAPEQVLDVTRAILDLFRAKGSRERRNAARFRFLVEEIGVAGVLAWLQEHLPYRLPPCVREPVPASSYDELIGWFRQRDPELWTLGLCVPLGRLTWQQLEGLAVLSRKWGDGQLRVTHEQGIAVCNIPTAFKDAAATDTAALGLSLYGDPLERNTMACTGSQFCNIAVVETKGQMLQLMETLRQRGVKLHGIRIHMSGCPSSCAQHFTADIGLKGVRVRRAFGTREGFDVYLGGGIAGQVHMALPYRLGVDTGQLPALIEEVVREYYLRHQTGQTFSAYWRARLQAQQAAKVGDHDYQQPTWLCENCAYEHVAEDPPVFCPRCAALRRSFARLEDSAAGSPPQTEAAPPADLPPERSDGYLFAANEADLTEGQGLTVTVAGRELALFRSQGKVLAVDSACPHEGAPLAEGDFAGGIVTCPWHSWEFDVCTGCSLQPTGYTLGRYPTLIEGGKIFVALGTAAEESVAADTHAGTVPATDAATTSGQSSGSAARPKLSKPVEADLEVLEVIEEAPDVRTFRLANSGGRIPLDLPGRFAKVAVSLDGELIWRSFTISSSPTHCEQLDLTIKLNPFGLVSPYLFEHGKPGSLLRIKGPQGGFCFDPARHPEPLVLISAGSGATPMISIARYLAATGSDQACTYLFGARTCEDVLFQHELQQLQQQMPGFRYVVSLSRGDADWTGSVGRLSMSHVQEAVPDLHACRYFVCGPHEFIETFRNGLAELGLPTSRIHSERFHDTAVVRR